MKNILVLTDFSENAKAAEKYALQVAIKIRANLLLYNAYTEQPNMRISGNVVWPHDEPLSMQFQSMSHLESRVSELKKELNLVDSTSFHPEVSHTCNEGDLVRNLKDVVSKNIIWLVIMGTKGEGFANNLLFGSNVFKVLENISCPVLIVSQNTCFEGLGKIAYATDLRSDDLFIIEWLHKFTQMFEAELMIAHISPDTLSDQEHELSKKEIERIYRNKFPKTYITLFQGQDIKDSLLQIIEQKDMNILALMHRKHGFFDSLFHASTAHKIVKHTKLPVLIFPDTEKNANIGITTYGDSVLND